MKSELEKFNRKTVEEIYRNYKATKKVKKNKNFKSNLKEQTKHHEEILHYKNLLDNEEIEEKDIPKEYYEELKKLYYEEISDLKTKLKNNKK